jgi:hypothetical protein
MAMIVDDDVRLPRAEAARRLREEAARTRALARTVDGMPWPAGMSGERALELWLGAPHGDADGADSQAAESRDDARPGG